MCGIVGSVSTSPLDPDILRKMTDTLVHRGPDADGYFTSPDGHVSFGHRRLSIIDLVSGDQPMQHETHGTCIVFNGEIYNFRDLRKELEGRGHSFQTNSDTEIILACYKEYGTACVEHFNGMFAFAIYDRDAQRVFIARDRFGKKPLYYAMKGDTLLFASEAKALRVHPSIGNELDVAALSSYLAFEYVPSPLSIFKDIKKLPPAHHMVYDVDSRRANISRYWSLAFLPKSTMDEKSAQHELLERLRDAVRLRLVSDVPLGVFLSGGIDSSTVVALTRELLPAQQIKTFNIGFREKSFDESHYARQTADRFQTDHHEEVFSFSTMLDCLDDVIEALDEPFGDASLLPTYLLSKFTRSQVTVALGGDGCDEVFAGYPTYPASRAADWFRSTPRIVQRAVEAAANRMPVSTANFSLDFKLTQFLKGARYSEPTRTQTWLGSFGPDELQQVMSEQLTRSALDPLAGLSFSTSAHWLDNLISHYINLYLADDILFKVDRASMASSLEVRAPFLDHRYVEFVATLPSSFKLRGWKGKYLLKKAMEGRLPASIVHRPKKGFGIPVAQWLKDELAEMAAAQLSFDKLTRQGLLNPRYVSTLLQEHQSGLRNHRKQLWTLLVLEWWAQRHLS